MNQKADYYNQASLWNGVAEYQHNVMEDISRYIPKGVKTILDVGCGSGLLINSLMGKYECTGIDISETALSHVKCKKILGSSNGLPFSDQSFDLIMINDVLEHLEPAILSKTLQEIIRVSAKYIIISVPFMENLKAGMTTCSKCGYVYHITHHLNSFGVKEICEMFPSGEMTLKRIIYSGARHLIGDLVQYELRAANHLYTKWAEAMCPCCGANASSEIINREDTASFYHGISSIPQDIPTQFPDRNECISLFSKETNTKHDTQAGLRVLVGEKVIPGSFRVSPKGRLVFSKPIHDKPIHMELIDQNGIIHTLPHPQNDNDLFIEVPLWFNNYTLSRLSRQQQPDDLILKMNLLQNADMYNKINELIVNNSDLTRKLDLLFKQVNSSELQNIHNKLNKLIINNSDLTRKLDLLFEQVNSSEVQDMDNNPNELIINNSDLTRENDVPDSSVKCSEIQKKSWYSQRSEIEKKSEPDFYGCQEDDAKKHFLIICHDQNIDRRIIQQAECLCQNNWSGIIVALSFDQEDHLEKNSGYQIHRIATKHIIPPCKCYWLYNRLAHIKSQHIYSPLFSRLADKMNFLCYRVLCSFHYRCKPIKHPLPFDLAFFNAGKYYQADLVLAEDLPALKAATILKKNWDCKLIFDSHEFYPEQNVFSSTQKKIMHTTTKRFIKDCNAVITVSDGIAELFHKFYGIAKPEVIHNVTNKTSIRREKIFHRLLSLNDSQKIILYQGGIIPSRNIENLLSGYIRLNPTNAHLVFLGPTTSSFMEKLKKMAGKLLDDKIHFLAPVPQEELLNYTAAADFGVIPYKVIDLNTKYCMPNKFFEFIQAGLPILANHLVEVEKIIKNIGGGGMIANLNSPNNVKAALQNMLARDLKKDHEILLSAQDKISWDYESQTFMNIINKVMQ